MALPTGWSSIAVPGLDPAGRPGRGQDAMSLTIVVWLSLTMSPDERAGMSSPQTAPPDTEVEHLVVDACARRARRGSLSADEPQRRNSASSMLRLYSRSIVPERLRGAPSTITLWSMT
jgi:hypothetical protein